jgi:hypothetical protein
LGGLIFGALAAGTLLQPVDAFLQEQNPAEGGGMCSAANMQKISRFLLVAISFAFILTVFLAKLY